MKTTATTLLTTLALTATACGSDLTTLRDPCTGETVGAYEQLAEGVLSVAPTDVEGTTERLYEALTMSDEERARRQAILVEAIEREDLLHWLHRQFQDIRGVA